MDPKWTKIGSGPVPMGPSLASGVQNAPGPIGTGPGEKRGGQSDLVDPPPRGQVGSQNGAKCHIYLIFV